MEDLCMLDSTDWSGRTTTEKVYKFFYMVNVL